MTLDGALATFGLRRHHPDPSGLIELFQRIMLNLYVPKMQIVHRISGRDLALIRAMARSGEQPTTPSEHYLVSTEEHQSSAQAINAHARSSTLQAQNADKRFDCSIRHFKPQQEVMAPVAVEQGHHREYGCAVFF
jgi:hypothetical protein